MPSVNIEGVGLVNFPDDMKPEDITRAIEKDILPSVNKPQQAAEDSSDLLRGITNYVPQMKETWGGMKVLTGKILGSNDLMQSGLQTLKEAKAEIAPNTKKTDSFSEAWKQGMGAVLTDWLPYQVGSGIANLGESLAVMTAGAMVGSVLEPGVGTIAGGATGLLEKELVKRGIREGVEKILKEEGKDAAEAYFKREAGIAAKELAKDIGGKVGLASQAAAHGMGETTSRAVEEAQTKGGTGTEFELSRVAPAAAVHAVAEYFGDKIGLGAWENINKDAKTGLLNMAAALLKETAVTGTKEAPVEVIQSMAERFGANLSLADAEAIKEYIDSAAASYGMAIAPSVGGTARSYAAAMQREDKRLAEEAAKQQAALTQQADQSTQTAEAEAAKIGTTAVPNAEGEVVAPSFSPLQVGSAHADALASLTDETLQADNEAKLNAEAEAATESKAELPPAKRKDETPGETKYRYERTLELGLTENGKPLSNKQRQNIEKKLEGMKEVASVQPTTTVVAGNQPSTVSTAPAEGGTAGGTQASESAGVDVAGTPTVAANVAEGTQRPALTPAQIKQGYQLLQDEHGGELPAWKDLTPDMKKDFMQEIEAALQTKGMLPSKGATPTVSPRIAALKKVKAIIDTYEENKYGRLPSWSNLNDDERDLYLSQIRNNTAEEQDKALALLAGYRKSNEVITEEGNIEKGEVPEGASIYELNRQAYSSELPRWGDLDEAARSLFLKAIEPGLVRNEKGKITERKVTAEHMDTGFADVWIHNAEKEARETSAAKEKEKQAEQKRQEHREREATPEVETGERLPKSVILQLFNGDIKGVLQHLSRSAQGMESKTQYTSGRTIDKQRKIFSDMQKAISRVLFRNLSSVLNTLVYNSKVVMDESNPVIKQLRREGKLAAYDPKTDTFYFTNDGLDEQTVLHEIVHAATIKILHAYKTNPSSLTQEQRDAAEHIEKIYDFAKSRIGGRHKFAFENVFEFVSYAMTDPKLQADLANIQARSLGKYSNKSMSFLRSITERFGSLWGQFTQALMKMYGLTKAGREFVPAENIPDDLVKAFNELPQEELEGPRRKGVIYQRPATERVSKEAISRGAPQAGYEANLLVEMSEAFGRILAAPEGGVDMEALPAKAPNQPKKPKPKQPAPAGGSTNFKDIVGAMPSVTTNVRQEVRKMGFAKTAENIIRLVQNDRVALKNWQNRLRYTGRLIAYAAGFNNIYDQITLSSGNAFHLYTQYIQNDTDAIRKEITDYAARHKLNIDEAVNELGAFAIALHEGERRQVLYLREVPLESVVQTLQDAKGNKFTADAARAAIIKRLTTEKLSKAQAKQLRADLEAIVKDKRNWDKKAPAERFDINDEKYSVAGFTPDQIKSIKAEYNKRKAEIDPIMKRISDVNKSVLKLNEMSNYLSEYANNFIEFYGFNNYVPMKGKFASAQNSDKADLFNFDSRRIGGELQEGQHAMDGRTSVPDNPVLQVLADGAQASLRAGRRYVTESIANAIEDKTLAGETVTTLSFDDRFNTDQLDKLRGQNVIFHYMPDGKIKVLRVNDSRVADAIRRTYREANPLTDWLIKKGNLMTGTIGQMHTRYNVAFAPVNFVRDVLTNAFTMGAELGPKATFQYIGAVAADVASGKMSKTMNFARLYHAGKVSEIETLAKNDPSGYYKDLLDYIKTGGKVSYISGIATKGQFQELQKTVGASKVLSTKDKIDKVFDTWIDTFELSARVSAFRITKASEVARMTKEDPKRSKAEIESAATTTAAAYAKNLANFEQVGEWGKALGAFFMFFRPSATGAVRAFDAIAPMFQGVERAKLGLPEYARMLQIKQDLAGKVSKTEKAKLEAELAKVEKYVDSFEENYARRRKNAMVMTAALAGVGFTTYLMSLMLADDDDFGRNKTATDDMSRWTRNARFFIPGLKDPIQIPWGYGLGAFAAAGAQVGSMFNGNTRLGDTIGNLTTISMDSFLPLPVSRIPPLEQPLPFVIDSFMPSIARPLVEYVMNVDALGRQIYNNRQTRFGDAYTGGDNIPEIYKSASIWWLETTGADVSPNSLYFFANNYADGASRIVHNSNNIRLWLTGKKDFDAKTDLMVFDSFIGKQSNFDARQWQRIENDLKERSAHIKMLKENNLAEYADYLSKHPLDKTLADMYNHDVNGRLRDLRARANQYRALPGIDPKTRTELVNNIVLQENLEKRRLINIYEAYGVKP